MTWLNSFCPQHKIIRPHDLLLQTQYKFTHTPCILRSQLKLLRWSYNFVLRHRALLCVEVMRRLYLMIMEMTNLSVYSVWAIFFSLNLNDSFPTIGWQVLVNDTSLSLLRMLRGRFIVEFERENGDGFLFLSHPEYDKFSSEANLSMMTKINKGSRVAWRFIRHWS